jgi:hypothetical protein
MSVRSSESDSRSPGVSRRRSRSGVVCCALVGCVGRPARRAVYGESMRSIMCSSSWGGGVVPGPPPEVIQLASSSKTSVSSADPNQVAFTPVARCGRDGLTTMTLECSHGPRQSLVRMFAWPLKALRSRCRWSACGIRGCLVAVPQQHPRHTVTVGWSGSKAMVVFSRFGRGAVPWRWWRQRRRCWGWG